MEVIDYRENLHKLLDDMIDREEHIGVLFDLNYNEEKECLSSTSIRVNLDIFNVDI